MQMRNARVRTAKLNMSLRLDMESSRGSLTKELFMFEPRTSSMKLTKIDADDEGVVHVGRHGFLVYQLC